eukprot:5237232-Pleurochrysis_carterae.AAC.2
MSNTVAPPLSWVPMASRRWPRVDDVEESVSAGAGRRVSAHRGECHCAQQGHHTREHAPMRSIHNVSRASTMVTVGGTCAEKQLGCSKGCGQVIGRADEHSESESKRTACLYRQLTWQRRALLQRDPPQPLPAPPLQRERVE